MAVPSLDGLPAELQLMIFGFAYTDCHIHIEEYKEGLAGIPIAATTRSTIEHTFISKDLYAAACSAYLSSASWSFASITAAEAFTKSTKSLAVVPYIRHIQIDARRINPVALLCLLYQTSCAVRTVELTGCTAYDFGVRKPSLSTVYQMQRDEAEVIEHLLDHSCRATDVRELSWRDLENSPFVHALAVIPTLEDVAVGAECGLCAEYDLDCDWALVARKAERVVLQVGTESRAASRRKMRSVTKIEAEIRALENAMLRRDELECIDVHCGEDWEGQLETDDELEALGD